MLIIEPQKTESRFDLKIFFWTFLKKNFFVFKNTIKSSQHEKLEKNFLRVKSDFSFLRLTDKGLFQ